MIQQNLINKITTKYMKKKLIDFVNSSRREYYWFSRSEKILTINNCCCQWNEVRTHK